ncbi:MAG: hypothetical protein R3182_08255, partial [Draconibacterium sp.]|nr:hypothetical protein [Draconibacterium sp.]
MDINEQIYTRYDELKEICRLTWDDNSLQKLNKTFNFVRSVVGENQFNTGEYILNHSLDVANIIASEIGLEPDSVISGLL